LRLTETRNPKPETRNPGQVLHELCFQHMDTDCSKLVASLGVVGGEEVGRMGARGQAGGGVPSAMGVRAFEAWMAGIEERARERERGVEHKQQQQQQQQQQQPRSSPVWKATARLHVQEEEEAASEGRSGERDGRWWYHLLSDTGQGEQAGVEEEGEVGCGPALLEQSDIALDVKKISTGAGSGAWQMRQGGSRGSGEGRKSRVREVCGDEGGGAARLHAGGDDGCEDGYGIRDNVRKFVDISDVEDGRGEEEEEEEEERGMWVDSF
jgi:hypothetical protein